MKRPETVQDIVGRRGAKESQRIGRILVQAKPLLAKIGDFTVRINKKVYICGLLINPDRLRNYEKFPLYLLFILGG